MSKRIYLSGNNGAGMYATVSDEDYERLASYSWCLHSKGYVCRGERRDGKSVIVLLHREVVGALKGEHVDHIDHDKLNNTRDNLRVVTQKENNCNQVKRTGTTSKYLGVSWSKSSKKWRASVGSGNYWYAYFDDEVEAARERDKVARKLFGDNGTYNFPLEPA